MEYQASRSLFLRFLCGMVDVFSWFFWALTYLLPLRNSASSQRIASRAPPRSFFRKSNWSITAIKGWYIKTRETQRTTPVALVSHLQPPPSLINATKTRKTRPLPMCRQCQPTKLPPALPVRAICCLCVTYTQKNLSKWLNYDFSTPFWLQPFSSFDIANDLRETLQHIT